MDVVVGLGGWEMTNQKHKDSKSQGPRYLLVILIRILGKTEPRQAHRARSESPKEGLTAAWLRSQ